MNKVEGKELHLGSECEKKYKNTLKHERKRSKSIRRDEMGYPI